MLDGQRLKIVLYRMRTLKFQSGREIKEFRIEKWCPDNLWILPTSCPPGFLSPCPPSSLYAGSCMNYLTRLGTRQGIIITIFANNLPSRLTHLDPVEVGSLQLSLAGEGSFPTGQRQSKTYAFFSHTSKEGKRTDKRAGLCLSNSFCQTHPNSLLPWEE